MQAKITKYTNMSQKAEKGGLFQEKETSLVPQAWKMVMFDECVLKKRFKVGKVKKQKYKLVGRYPIIDQSKNFIAGYTDNEEKLYRGNLPVIIFGDHTRIFKFVDFPFVLGADGSKVLLPNNNLFDPKFLYFAFLDLDILNLGYNRHFKVLREKSVPCFSLPEQRKIAKVLSIIQRAIEQQDKIIEAVRNLKKSLVQKLFTEGMKGEEQKETEIGIILKSWKVVALRDVCLPTTKINPEQDPEGDFYYVEISSVDSSSGKIVSYRKLKGKDAPSRARKQIRKGDVIFATTRPYLKNIAKVPAELDNQICSTGFCVLRSNNSMTLTNWIYYSCIKDDFISRVSSKMHGTSYPAVLDSQVKDELIPLPPLPEQQEITHILSATDKKIEVEEKRKVTLNELFKTMVHKLMTGEIRLKDVEV